MTVLGSVWRGGSSSARAALAAAVGVLCGLAGYLAPVPLGMAAASRGAEAAPAFVHPGAVLAEAARRMHPQIDVAAAEGAGVEGEIDRSIDVTPAAPRPDIAEVFRRELSAVVADGTGEAAVVVATDGTLKTIAVGGAYRDGWRVHDIAPDAIKLVRRSEVRRIAVMGDYPAFAGSEPRKVFAQAPRRRVLSRADAAGGSR